MVLFAPYMPGWCAMALSSHRRFSPIWFRRRPRGCLLRLWSRRIRLGNAEVGICQRHTLTEATIRRFTLFTRLWHSDGTQRLPSATTRYQPEATLSAYFAARRDVFASVVGGAKIDGVKIPPSPPFFIETTTKDQPDIGKLLFAASAMGHGARLGFRTA